jgi:hypothetical protein
MRFPSLSRKVGPSPQLKFRVVQQPVVRHPVAPQLGAQQIDAAELLEQSLREILLVCQEACAARQTAVKDSAEWHKRTGEILACAKLTDVLLKLQQRLRAQCAPDSFHRLTLD